MDWKSESIAELAAALAKAQADFRGAKADSENPFFKSKYADLESVWESVRGPLTSNGLSVSQLPVGVEGQMVSIMTVLMHSSGQWVSSVITLPAVKADPQAYGSSYTYARRYALQAILCVPTVDDDGEGAMQRSPAAIPTATSTHGPVNGTPQRQQTTGGDVHGRMTDKQNRALWGKGRALGVPDGDVQAFLRWAAPVTSKEASMLIESFDARWAEWIKHVDATPSKAPEDIPF